MRFSIPARGAPQLGGATWIRAEDRELAHPILIRLGLGDDGRLVATGLLVEADGELTSRELRIPLARIVADFADEASKPATHSRLFSELLGIGYQWIGEVPPKIPDLWQGLLPVTTKERRIRRVRPGRRGHSDAFYRQVAQDYRQVKRDRPRAPIRALMQERYASEATVHRWLNTAVAKGFLKAKER